MSMCSDYIKILHNLDGGLVNKFLEGHMILGGKMWCFTRFFSTVSRVLIDFRYILG
jgi:hypothetical protein